MTAIHNPSQASISSLFIDPITESTDLIPPLARIVAEYVINAKNWDPLYLQLPCPIRAGETKADGSSYKIGDTHTLYLKAFNTIEKIEKAMQEKDLIPFKSFHPSAHEQYYRAESRAPQYLLVFNDLLPDSRGRSYSEQVERIQNLNKRINPLSYTLPGLTDTLAYCALSRCEKKESFLQTNDQHGDNHQAHTWIEETIDGSHLVVGAHIKDTGLTVEPRSRPHPTIGTIVMMKFDVPTS
jgi:hypothetical protein